MVCKGVKQVGVVAVSRDGYGVFVGGFNSSVILRKAGNIGLGLCIDHGCYDVFSSQFLTVMELNAFSEFENPGAAVFRDSVALSKIGDRVHVVVELHETVVAENIQECGLQSIMACGRQVVGFVRSCDDESVFAVCGCHNRHGQHHDESKDQS